MSDGVIRKNEDRYRCLGCGGRPDVLIHSTRWFAEGIGICEPCARAAVAEFEKRRPEIDAFRSRARPGTPEETPR